MRAPTVTLAMAFSALVIGLSSGDPSVANNPDLDAGQQRPEGTLCLLDQLFRMDQDQGPRVIRRGHGPDNMAKNNGLAGSRW